MHRRSGGDNWVRSAELASGLLNPASGHLLQLFAAQELLAASPGDELFDRRLALVEAARLDRTEQVANGRFELASATVRLAAGIGFGANLDRYGAAVVATLDGSEPLRARIAPLAAELELSEADLSAFAAQLLHHLVEHGFAVPV